MKKGIITSMGLLLLLLQPATQTSASLPPEGGLRVNKFCLTQLEV